MIILTLSENCIVEKGCEIPDLSFFLKNLPVKTEMALILKPPEVLYHFCPVRKAVPYLKAAEFPPDYWVGERVFPKGRVLVGGISPSLFMQNSVSMLAEQSYALKGVFLWADLVTQAYGVLPPGWALICHDQHLMICHNGILRISRPGYLPLVQELPAILRYLKRFGYQEGMPLTLLQAFPSADPFPPFVHQETRVLHEFSLKGFTFHIPALVPLQRFYAWPRTLQKIVYAITLLNFLGIAYLSWHIKPLSYTFHTLTAQLGTLPTVRPMDKAKVEAFKVYCHLLKDRPHLLPLLRQLIPLLKEEATVIHLHWVDTPLSLVLYIQLTPSANADQFLLGLGSQLQGYRVVWQEKDDDPLQGILTLTLNQQES